MLFTYLRRELRRRLRQAIFISVGLALGVGLVITVTAASSGVKNAQSTVLHSLYGVGTDVTVTQAPPKGTSGTGRFNVGSAVGGRPQAGTYFSRDVLTGTSYGTLTAASVSDIARLPDVSAAGGALALTDLKVSGTIRARGGSSSAQSSISSDSFAVQGAAVSGGEVGPLSSAKLTSGRTLSPSDATSSVALADSDYAAQNKLKPGSKITIGGPGGGGTTFTVIGLVQAPPGTKPADMYIPLARAQALGTGPQGAGLKNKVNTIYVSAASGSDIPAVQKEISKLLPAATVTTSGDLANQVTGSLASTATLADNLGKWLEAAVLIAAFLLASLLTMAAVSRRVREFGTLKALGWRTRRIVAQVMGETITMGIAGGLAGVGLGFGGAALVAALAPAQTATVGQSVGSAAPGGGRRPGVASILQNLNHSAVHTVSVSLTAPVTTGVVVAAVLLAIAGGLIAGVLGGWRAARLRPAAALARVE